MVRKAAVVLAGAAAGAASLLLLALAVRWGWAMGADFLLQRALALAQARDPRALALLAAGAFAGATVGAAATGSRRARSLLRSGLGASTGALAGLATYAVGYAAAAWGEGLAGFAGIVALGEAAVRSGTMAEVLCVGVGAVVGLVLARCSWRAWGVLSYVAIASVVAGYVLHSALVGLPAVPPRDLPVSLALFALETLTLGMALLHAFYSLDVVSRKRWARRPADAPFSRYHQPKVAVHVAVYNEPPAMVLETLRSVLALDYPRDRLFVLVLDDSTDAAARETVRRFCEERGIAHHHRAERRGFKAGALNEGLRLTPKDADLVAVLDADYQVSPEYLRETVGHFIDPRLGFLQTPQDYRNAAQSFLARQYARADAYFYRAVLPSRNEENAIIFCGTMGILRRAALEDAGGWSEEHLCEDAELSLRILDGPYHSLYVNKTYGRGLLPATFDAYRKQHHRWAYGSGQVLRTHWRRLLVGRLTARQKLDFLVGGVHWFEGWTFLLMALALLGLGVADLLGNDVLTHHAGEVWLLALVPFFLLVDSLLRLHLALRQSLDVPRRATFAVLGMWMSVKLSNARGVLAGVRGVPLAFARTDKTPERRLRAGEALRRVFRLAPEETMLAGALVAVAAGLAWKAAHAVDALALPRALLAAWLALHALGLLCAPLYAFLGYVTLAPEAPAEESSPREPALVGGGAWAAGDAVAVE